MALQNCAPADPWRKTCGTNSWLAGVRPVRLEQINLSNAPDMTCSSRLTSRAFLVLVAGSLSCSGDNTNPNPNDPTKLAIATQPSASAQSGQAFAVQPVVQVQDANGNSVAAPSGTTVTAALATGTATLGGTLSVAVDASGKASFTNLSLSGPAGT